MTVRAGRPAGDDGAVAIIVALLMLTMLGLTSFAVDAGSGYATKRQLATAADAAVLAAGADYAGTVGEDCPTLAADPTVMAAAKQDAYTAFTSNINSGYFSTAATSPQPTAPSTTVLTVTCNATDTALDIAFSDAATTQPVLAEVYGINHINIGRSATAAVAPTGYGVGVRPAALCLQEGAALGLIPPGGGAPTVQPVYFPDPSHKDLGCGKPPSGNYYLLQCPGQGNSSDKVLGQDVLTGCPQPVQVDSTEIDTVIDGSTAPDGNQLTETGTLDFDGDTDNLSATIVATLDATCNTSPGTPPANCLSASTGNKINSGNTTCPGTGNVNNVVDALYCLTANATTVLFPVIYPASPFGNGGNVNYPIYGLIGATVCGFSTNSGKAAVNNSSPACAGAAAPSMPTTQNYLLLKYAGYQSTGDAGGNCAIGTGCDGGNRQVTLIQ